MSGYIWFMNLFFGRNRFIFSFAVLILAEMQLLHTQESVYADRIVKIASPVNTICWNHNGNWFAIGEENTVVIRDAQTSSILYELSLPQVMKLQFSHENRKDTSSGSDILLGVSPKCIALWDLSQNPSTEARTDFNKVVPSDEENYKTTMRYTPTEINLIQLDGANYIATAAISKNSNYIAAAANDGAITVYPKSRDQKARDKKEFISQWPEGRRVRALSFSPDNSRISSISDGATIRIWNTEGGSFVKKLDVPGGLPISAVFSSDSNHIFVSTSRNVISLMDFDGKIISNTNVKPLRQFMVSSDDNTLITLTEDDMFEFYDVDTGKLRGHIPSFSNSPLKSFAFNSDYTQLLTGHEDGSVYKLNVTDNLLKRGEDTETANVDKSPVKHENTKYNPPESTPKETDSGTDNNNANGQRDADGNSESPMPENTNNASEEGDASNSSVSQNPQSRTTPVFVPFDFQSALRERFSAFNVGASAIMLDKKSTYYQFGTAVEFDWYTTLFTAPVYEGLGARFAMAFPADNFPVTYKTLDGNKRIDPPYLFFGEVFVPVGVEVPVSTFVSLFSELAFEAKVNWLMNPGVTSSKQGFSLGGKIRTGIIISKIAVILGAEYDSMWGFIPEISITANFKLRNKNKDKEGKK